MGGPRDKNTSAPCRPFLSYWGKRRWKHDLTISNNQWAPATDTPPADQLAAAPPPETTAPKLQKVQGAVIIRRGDSLWRISRRVYGRGLRYSTIYLANQEQIRDPNRIWPGQVFRVPDKTKDGESADMTKIGAQAVTTVTTE